MPSGRGRARRRMGAPVSWPATPDRPEPTYAVSRRSVLGAGLAVPAGLALGPVVACDPSGAETPHSPRVVVVGAGLAGLVTTHRLAQHGVRARLFEANPHRVGGRCWTARGFHDGQVAEHGGEFVDTRHVQLRRLVSELRLHLDDLEQAWPEGARELLYLHGRLRNEARVYDDFDVVEDRLSADMRRIGSYLADEAGAAAREFDEMSAQDWLVANVPGGARSLLAAAIGGAASTLFGEQPENLSAINLIEQYVAPYPGADERYHIREGSDSVVAGLVGKLPHGALTTDAALRAIERRGSTYRISFDGHPMVVADVVVLALPFTTLRDVDLDGSGLSDRKREAIDHHGMGQNAKLLVQFDEPLERHHRWSGSLSADKPSWETWDSSLAQRGRSRVLTVFLGGGDGGRLPVDLPHGTASTGLAADTVGFLDRLVPGLRTAYGGTCWADSWVDDPWVHGSYASFRPGQYTKYWGYSGTREGGIHFAGEHTSTHSQGYLNGGVESGERAAREVLKRLRGRR